MGILAKLLVCIVAMVTVEGAITGWYHASRGQVGVSDDEKTYADARDFCIAEGSDIYNFATDQDRATLVSALINNVNYFAKTPEGDCKIILKDSGQIWTFDGNCDSTYRYLCSAGCNPPPTNCTKQENNDCSKTCGLGFQFMRYTCGRGINPFTCQLQCCCRSCTEGTGRGIGNGVPPPNMCKAVHTPTADHC